MRSNVAAAFPAIKRSTGALAVLVCMATAAEAAPLPVRFDMGFSFEGAQAFFPLAQDSGCFDRAGISLTMDRGYGSSDTAAKVAAGAYDIGEMDFNTLMQFDARSPDKKLTAIFVIGDSSPMSVQAFKSSGITKPKDLAGKRISDLIGEASRVMFPAFAKANGLDPNSVTWITAAPALNAQLLVQGRTDAIAGHIFNVFLGLHALGVEQEQLTALRYADWGLDVYGGTVATTPAWAASHPDAAKAFVACTVSGIKAMVADPDAAVAAVHKRNPLSDVGSDRASLASALSVAILTPNVKKNGLSSVDHSRLERTMKQTAEALEIAVPEIDDVWTDKYLPPRQELMVAQ
jgi:NitT/TauT family transport system substrate-binding protein